METLKATTRIRNWLAWFILAIALAFAVFVRGRLAEFPFERDEGEYAYAGQLILQGVPPYSLAYNMKLPGTYLAYAGLMAVFGQTTAGVHLGLLAVNLVTIVLIFFFARDLFDSLAGAVAAACFSVLSISPVVLGMAAHATHFMAVFGMAGAWVLWRATRSDKVWPFAASGVLLGLAFLTKQQGVFLPCFGGLATLVVCLRRRPIVSLRHLAICLSYAAGAVLPLAATCLWLWQAGTFEKFWFWTVEYARTYVEQISLGDGIQIFWQNVPGVIGPNWPIWVLALIGAIALACTKGVPGRRTFVFGFLAFSFLCVCPGFYFRQHYFIVLLPCIAMLAGVGFTTVVDLAAWLGTVDAAASGRNVPLHAQRRDLPKTKAAAPTPNAVGSGLVVGLAALLPMAAVTWPVYLQSGFFFSWPPEEACRRVYWLNPFVECPVIAEYIKANSSPEDRVAVLGSEPEILFDADRQSATGYIYTYALMEPHPFARKMQEEMIAEIEAAKPEYIVYVDVYFSWLPRPKSDTYILQWIGRYVSQNYFPVGLVEMPDRPNEQTQYKWNADVLGAQPRPKSSHLWVFRRKP